MSEKAKQRRLNRIRRPLSVDVVDDPYEKQLAYVAEVSKNARTSWFGLIGLLLFCGVTLLAVEDRDFFEYGVSTQLPLIGVSVPTKSFFWAAPLLVTGLYTYLHLYLDKLWKALRRLPDEIEGRPVTHVVWPWLISDTALERRPDVERSPYWFVTRFVTLCLCWLIGPAALLLFWIKSWAPHDERLTLLIGAQLAWLCLVGANSWLGMCRETEADRSFFGRMPRGGLLYLGLILSILISAVGYSRTESGQFGELYEAELYRAEFTIPDKDWRGRDAAWRAYQRAHRRDVVLELIREGQGEQDVSEAQITERLKREFEQDRAEARAALERRDYVGEDLRNADLREAFLVGLDLRDARMEGADLTRARMEGADLIRAEMTDAVVQFASVIGARLSQVRNLTQEQLNQMYGDGLTPQRIAIQRREGDDWVTDYLQRPAHWPSVPIPEEQRIACWKEWAIRAGAWKRYFPDTDVECTTHAEPQ